MSPEDVAAALVRMESGDASAEVFETIVEGARAFASLTPEWLLVSPQTGLYYVSRNEMLIDTMRAAKPDTLALHRLAPPYPQAIEAPSDSGRA
jgi:hypothetical protein